MLVISAKRVLNTNGAYNRRGWISSRGNLAINPLCPDVAWREQFRVRANIKGYSIDILWIFFVVQYCSTKFSLNILGPQFGFFLIKSRMHTPIALRPKSWRWPYVKEELASVLLWCYILLHNFLQVFRSSWWWSCRSISNLLKPVCYQSSCSTIYF